MVSPELLRRYPFFGSLTEAELRSIAMVTEEEAHTTGDLLFKANRAADALYLLIDGSIDLIYIVDEPGNGSVHKEFHVGEINPGEVFGISALIEPHAYTATARVGQAARVLKIEASALRAVLEVDPLMAYGLMRYVAKTAIERLNDTRVQLAAARA
jgi:CRP/FNR family cyclic AMP-dependent transcriptional regulator